MSARALLGVLARLEWAVLAFAAFASPAQAQDAQQTTNAQAEEMIWSDDCWLLSGPPLSAPREHHLDIGQALDDVTLEPLSKAYAVLPRPIRLGVHHVLSNLDEPDIAVNDMLQGHPRHAAVALFRFATNTTIGIGGLFDVAGRMGAHHHDNDAATTLAAYGIPTGPSFHLPLVETDNLRDVAGFAIDFVIDPVGWGQFRNADAVYAGQMVMDAVDDRSNALEAPSEGNLASANVASSAIVEVRNQHGRTARKCPDFLSQRGGRTIHRC